MARAKKHRHVIFWKVSAILLMLLAKERLNQFIDKGEQITQKLSSTIDDFRDFFKPHKTEEVFNLTEVVKNTLSLVGDSLKYHYITVKLMRTEDVRVTGLPSECSQVLSNIINNARDAIVANEVDDGQILIDVFREAGNGVIAVRDNGGGIPEDIKEKIFDPYFTTREERMGTGMGLYMSKVIIEDHLRGRIEARNVDDGAEFRIIIPLAQLDKD